MIDKDALKNNLTKKDIEQIVLDLGGSPPSKDYNDNLIFNTICHNPPNQGKFKLYYYDNSKMFTCYTDCGESFDIYELVKKIYNNYSFLNCVHYVYSYKSNDSSFQSNLPQITRIDDWKFIKRYEKKQNGLVKLPSLNKNLLDKFMDRYNEEWIREGISIETMKKFGIKHCPIENKIIIPHYDKDGDLVGIRGRALDPQEAEKRKYAPVKVQNKLCNHPVSFNLYGLNFNKDNIIKNNKIIIFEGEKSVMKCEHLLPENFSVAVGGSNLSRHQRELILSLQIEEVIIAFDKMWKDKNDIETKRKSFNKIKKCGMMLSPYMRTYAIVDNKDLLEEGEAPCDRGYFIFNELLKNKKEITTAI